jgi:hypothetical protein
MIVTSPDGQWAAIRRGREVALLASGAGPATSRIELPTDDADLVIVGPPSVLAIVTRGEAANRMVLHLPPYLDAVARLDLEMPMRIAGVTGPRVVLVSLDGKLVVVVRIAGRAMSAQVVDTGGAVEFAVGLERNQVLFGLPRKLEAWDAVSGRPLLRMQLQLPPPPRTVGPAHGHLWLTRPGSDDVLIFRLSDGRPFRHHVGASVDEVICHPASPLLIVATVRGLVRLHCFAHALTLIDAPWQRGVPMAQLVVGDDISLLGLPDDADEPWRVPIAGAGAPAFALEGPEPPAEPQPSAADKLRAMRDRALPELGEPARAPERPRRTPASAPGSSDAPADAGRAARSADARTWREPLAAFGAELARGTDAEVPVVAADTELGQLAHRLALPASARRALVVLYSLHLVGESALAIARLARALGDWTEPLGQGELSTLAMLRRRGGNVALRSSVTDLLDGATPRAIRLVGDGAAATYPGAARLLRDGRSDAVIESELAAQLGRIAVIEGGPALGLLEARLQGTTAVAMAAPPSRPAPWPRDAGLIVVADPAAPAWVAALPSFTAA